MANNGRSISSANRLRLLEDWSGEAEHVIYHICHYREVLKWLDKEYDPWPECPTLAERTEEVCDWISIQHQLETDSFRRIAEAAAAWNRTHSAEGLPDSPSLRLDLCVAQSSIRLAMFPLLADCLMGRPGHETCILAHFISYAVRVRDWCRDLDPEWPRESADANGWRENQERWRFAQTVIRRYTPDTSQTPLALAIAEARQRGDLAILDVNLRALNECILHYVRQFARGGDLIDSMLQLNEAVNSLTPYTAHAPKIADGPGPDALMTSHQQLAGNPVPLSVSPLQHDVLASIHRLTVSGVEVWSWSPDAYSPDATCAPTGMTERDDRVCETLIIADLLSRDFDPKDLKKGDAIRAALAELRIIGAIQESKAAADSWNALAYRRADGGMVTAQLKPRGYVSFFLDGKLVFGHGIGIQIPHYELMHSGLDALLSDSDKQTPESATSATASQESRESTGTKQREVGSPRKNSKRKIGRRKRQPRGLTDKQQQAWTLYKRLGTHAKVGEEMGVSEERARTLYHEACAKLEKISSPAGKSVGAKQDLPHDQDGQVTSLNIRNRRKSVEGD